jgi:hypothetical protein
MSGEKWEEWEMSGEKWEEWEISEEWVEEWMSSDASNKTPEGGCNVV